MSYCPIHTSTTRLTKRLQHSIITRFLAPALASASVVHSHAYEVAVGLGSYADYSETIALGDRSKWPYVAKNSWGPLANLWPVGLLDNRAQQEAIFASFTNKRAITELPYPSIRWNSSQPDMDFIRSFGYEIPYVFVLYEHHERVREQGQATADALANAGVIDSMLTRDEILRLKARFPGKKIIMNTRSWQRNGAYLSNIVDVVDGICVEFMPHNTSEYISFDVAPFAAWAIQNDKDLLFLMPPLPDDHLEDRFVRVIKNAAQTIYDANKNILPHGWMSSNRIIFAPANYTWTGVSYIPYVPEDAKNSVLAAAKALLKMRPQLDAGTEATTQAPVIAPLIQLLLLDQ